MKSYTYSYDDVDYYIVKDDIGMLWGYGKTARQARKYARKRFFKLSNWRDIFWLLLDYNGFNAILSNKEQYDACKFFLEYDCSKFKTAKS